MMRGRPDKQHSLHCCYTLSAAGLRDRAMDLHKRTLRTVKSAEQVSVCASVIQRLRRASSSFLLKVQPLIPDSACTA